MAASSTAGAAPAIRCHCEIIYPTECETLLAHLRAIPPDGLVVPLGRLGNPEVAPNTGVRIALSSTLCETTGLLYGSIALLAYSVFKFGYILWQHLCGAEVIHGEALWAVFALPIEPATLPATRKTGPAFQMKLKTLFLGWRDDRGQDIAEYAVMLGVILTIVVGTIRLIGSHADNVFSSVGSAIQ